MKILTVSIYSHNLGLTKTFYKEKAGFELLEETPTHCSFKIGNSVLKFELTDQPTGIYHFAFSIPNNKIQEALGWVARRTAVLKNPDQQEVTNFPNWNSDSVYFYDLEGNLLEFITRYDQQVVNDQPFDADQVIGINEIGVATETPQATATTLTAEHELEYFVKGPRLEEFCVVGDEEGMFVISRLGRTWFPTATAAASIPLTATIEQNDKIYQVNL